MGAPETSGVGWYSWYTLAASNELCGEWLKCGCLLGSDATPAATGLKARWSGVRYSAVLSRPLSVEEDAAPCISPAEVCPDMGSGTVVAYRGVCGSVSVCRRLIRRGWGANGCMETLPRSVATSFTSDSIG